MQPIVLYNALDLVSRERGELSGPAAQVTLATTLVYYNIAMSRASVQQLERYLLAAMRRLLVAIVYKRSLTLPKSTLQDANVLSLLESDIEHIMSVMPSIAPVISGVLGTLFSFMLLLSSIGPITCVVFILALGMYLHISQNALF